MDHAAALELNSLEPFNLSTCQASSFGKVTCCRSRQDSAGFLTTAVQVGLRFDYHVPSLSSELKTLAKSGLYNFRHCVFVGLMAKHFTEHVLFIFLVVELGGWTDALSSWFFQSGCFSPCQTRHKKNHRCFGALKGAFAAGPGEGSESCCPS